MKCLSILHDVAALGGAHDIELQGSFAYVGGKGKGGNRTPPHAPGSFGVVDISDPRHLRVAGHLEWPPENGKWVQAETVLPAGDICFVGGTYFWSVDVSNPSRPVVLECLRSPEIESINGMSRRGDFIFAASKKNHVTVFDVRDPRRPALFAAFKPLGVGFASPHDIGILGDEHVVVVNIKEGEPRDKVHLYRVAQRGAAAPLPPERWALVGALDDPRLLGANRVLVRDGWAFVGCNKGNAVAAVDVRDPARPRLASLLATPSGPSGLCLVGPRLFAAPKPPGRFIEIYDVSDPDAMRLLDRIPTEGTDPDHDMAWRDGLLFVTDQDRDAIAVLEMGS